ncbi:glycine--tRNA ligase [Candidatus Micrarchaeota archaeon]|nr:glycine--tRNA ligase [Candidatus Micrarchaeota archaeon]
MNKENKKQKQVEKTREAKNEESKSEANQNNQKQKEQNQTQNNAQRQNEANKKQKEQNQPQNEANQKQKEQNQPQNNTQKAEAKQKEEGKNRESSDSPRPSPKRETESKIQKVINLCLRRGIIFPSAELYGSFGGFFDYGPMGVELKRNVANSWWRNFVQEREDMLGLDGTTITHPRIWKASGHMTEFNDPLVECGKCKQRFRADHLIEQELKISVDGISIQKVDELIAEHKLACPNCKGELSESRVFNLMFKTFIGATEDAASTAYLRPETAQVIFADFKQMHQIGRKALPFGIAQIGRAYRNEISPRNFVFRCREFEQMEIEFFLHPQKLDDCPGFEEIASEKALVCTAEHQEKGKEGEEIGFGEAIRKGIIKTRWHAYWLASSLKWFKSMGLNKLRLRQHVSTELSHYSKETWDVEYNYPEWGWKELQGTANRTDFDLKQHSKESGKDMSVFDEATKEKVTPHVIEPSFGLDRLVFSLLLDAYEESEENGEKKTRLKLHPSIAPLKVAVFPLMKKDGLDEKAKEIYRELKKAIPQSAYDSSGSIGKRYARMDEIGTPYCITIDYDTLTDDTVTIRERDSGEQKRIKVKEIAKKISL